MRYVDSETNSRQYFHFTAPLFTVLNINVNDVIGPHDQQEPRIFLGWALSAFLRSIWVASGIGAIFPNGLAHSI